MGTHMKNDTPLPKENNMHTIRDKMDLLEEKDALRSTTMNRVATANYNKIYRP